MTTISIVGCDHCGSTMLARLLATSNNVWCGGEIHWLMDTQPGEFWRTCAGWAMHRGCKVHGSFCRVLTPEFLNRRDLNSDTIYQELLRLSGKEILVATDKYPLHIRRFVKPYRDDNLGIVLFKDPEKSFLSYVKTKRTSPQYAVETYLSMHREIIDWAPTFFSRVVWVNFDDLIDHPMGELSRILDKLEVPNVQVTGELAADYCFLGGNEPAHKSKKVACAEQKDRVQTTEIIFPGFFAPLKEHENYKDLIAVYESLCCLASSSSPLNLLMRR